MVEGEPEKFRAGESAGRPIGGNISGEEFPQALYRLAASRGYESQLKLGKALGHKNNSIVGSWYQGKRVNPRPLWCNAKAI